MTTLSLPTIKTEMDYHIEQIEIILRDNQSSTQNYKYNPMIDSVQFEVADQEHVLTHSYGHYSDVESVHWCLWDVEILLNPKTHAIDIFCSYIDEDGNILGEDKLQWHELFETEEDFWAVQDHLIQLSKLQDLQLTAEVMS